MAVLRFQRESGAAEMRRFDVNGKERQRFGDEGIDEALVVVNVGGDDGVEIVIVTDVHGVQIVAVLIGRELLEAVDALQAAVVQAVKRGSAGGTGTEQSQERVFPHGFHKKAPFFGNPYIYRIIA